MYLVTRGSTRVGPPVLSGHALDGSGQVVLGAATLALLHKQVGDQVTISYGSPNTAPLYLPPVRATVVGTATFPAIAGSSTLADHTSMGTGALLSDSGLPASFLQATESPDPHLNGPALVFVRKNADASLHSGFEAVQRAVADADSIFAHDPMAVGDDVIT
ncbi:MAG TPA: hypothetical protein VED59_04075, partial [Acidimicrobiales bacterium]|nr:hypothetical protein [Acidimicrobiales bacterium]